MQTTTRNATLTDMMGMLQHQHARKIDVVAPATALRSVEGVLTIRGTEPIITEDGVTADDAAAKARETRAAVYRLAEQADSLTAPETTTDVLDVLPAGDDEAPTEPGF